MRGASAAGMETFLKAEELAWDFLLERPAQTCEEPASAAIPSFSDPFHQPCKIWLTALSPETTPSVVVAKRLVCLASRAKTPLSAPLVSLTHDARQHVGDLWSRLCPRGHGNPENALKPPRYEGTSSTRPRYSFNSAMMPDKVPVSRWPAACSISRPRRVNSGRP